MPNPEQALRPTPLDKRERRASISGPLEARECYASRRANRPHLVAPAARASGRRATQRCAETEPATSPLAAVNRQLLLVRSAWFAPTGTERYERGQTPTGYWWARRFRSTLVGMAWAGDVVSTPSHHRDPERPKAMGVHRRVRLHSRRRLALPDTLPPGAHDFRSSIRSPARTASKIDVRSFTTRSSMRTTCSGRPGKSGVSYGAPTVCSTGGSW